MKNENLQTNQLNKKRKVEWDDSVIDNEGKTIREKKKHKIVEVVPSHELANKKYSKRWEKSWKKRIRYAFENGMYDQIKEQIIKESQGNQHEIVKILTVRDNDPFEWAICNADIKALKLLTALLKDKQGKLKLAIKKDNYSMFKIFLKVQFSLGKLERYDQRNCVEGFKVFLEIMGNAFNEIISTNHYVNDAIRKAYEIAVEEFEIKFQLNQYIMSNDDIYISSINSKFSQNPQKLKQEIII